MLDALGNLGDFLGGIGVVVTLIYLALQIRQNTAATRVQTVQHLLTADTAAADSGLSGPIPSILSKLVAGDTVSPAEVSAYTIYMRGRITEAWQVYYQLQNGMIEKEMADALLGRLVTLMRPGLFRAVWNETLEIGFPVEIQQYVESLIEQVKQRRDDEARAQPQ